MILKQFNITPSMGKRLIGKALAAHPAVGAVLKQGTLVIVAGTTNGYVAEEVLAAVGQADGFNRKGFRRGMVSAPSADAASMKAEFPGDVVLVNGQWQRGKQIFDVIDGMKEGDLVLKGANAVHIPTGRAGVLIAHPAGGTVAAAIPAVIGRRVRLLAPVGLEKRVDHDVHELAAMLNAPGATGPRMMVLPGKSFTELDAIATLTGATAAVAAGGGVYGAEGSVWLAVEGDEAALAAAETLFVSLAGEGLCQG